MRKRRVRAALLSVAILGLLPLSAAAAPAAAAPQRAPVGEARIVIHQGTSTGGRVIAAATLYCFPTGGTHPRPYSACRALARAGGDIGALESVRRPCPMVYRPVTVVAKSFWRGSASFVVRGYSNLCTAVADSGGVFDLSRRTYG
ncbi:SSI family serine proteinase inhibitor [Streptomyces sp. NPDC050315]|uniref:SSI family serine proteinase inhibitor n=1 Tax=Streptomyces sp. NPDC050315 TaxID=3155039 RepID=UPI00343647AC